MSDLDIYVSIAANLEESGWSQVLNKLDKDTFAKIKAALDSVKDVADTKEEEKIPQEDPKAGIKFLADKFTKVTKALQAHRKKLETIDMRLRNLEENGVGLAEASADVNAAAKPRVVARPQRQLKTQNETKEAEDPKVDKSRRHYYQFGSRKLQVCLPSEGVPARKDNMVPPKARLQLSYSHGYNGNSADGRQNLYLTPDGKYLLYFIASVCVRHNLADNTQSFFDLHNDDITTLCIDNRQGSTWAASGQKDPKDRPGEGKDLPKVWVWDWKTMKQVKLINEVCWGKVARLQWSLSGVLYCLCGDEDQTLKAWDGAEFAPNKQLTELLKQPTMKEEILGFKIHPKPEKTTDEIVLFGKRKFVSVIITRQKDKLQYKAKAVSISTIKKDGESSFTCAEFLPDGNYAVGASSGAIYICKGSAVLGIVNAHEKSLGDIIWDGKLLITTGFDKTIKKFEIGKITEKNKSLLVEKWSKAIDIKESDLVFLPKAIAYDQTNNVVYCGTKTNQICSIEMKSENASVIVDGHDGQVWALCTHPSNAIFATGGYDNAVKLWNAEDSKCIRTFEFPLEEGVKEGKKVSSAAWSPDGNLLAFGTEDSHLFIFRYEPFEIVFNEVIPPKSKNAEVEAISYLRFSENSKLLGVAHYDSNIYIYSVEGGASGKVVLQRWDPLPHVAAPTNIQFSADGTMIKSLTRDYEICHWSLDGQTKKGKFNPTIPDPDKLKWGGDPLIAGWDVEGLYQPGWDGTDLNDCSVTSDGKYIASGDDYGTVRLHNYPAIAPEGNRPYHGHAEFVVGVEFLRDDSQLITCGGNDMAIFQWKLLKD